MTTPLTMDVVLDVVQNLAVAFGPKRTGDELKRLAFVYFDALSGVSAEGVRWAAKRVIREDTYFPKASRLIELGQKWEVSERSNGSDVIGTIVDPMLCHTCRQRFEYRSRWRPMNPRGAGGQDFRYWLTSADGQFLLLEEHSDRYVCACYKPLFVPDPRLTFPAVRVAHVAFHMPFKRSDVVVDLAA